VPSKLIFLVIVPVAGGKLSATAAASWQTIVGLERLRSHSE
jgi:hypothetical protein